MTGRSAARRTAWAIAGAAVALGVASLLAAAPAEAAKTRYLKIKKFKPRHGRTFVAIEQELRVRFSQPLDPASISAETVRLTTLDGDELPWTWRLEKKDRTLVVVPDRVFDPGTDYRFEVRSGLVSTKGRTLRDSKAVQFYTTNTVRPQPYLDQSQMSVLSTRLSTGRAFAGASVLDSGDVLLSGGQTEYDALFDQAILTDTCDVFQVANERVQVVLSTMQTRRAFHPQASIAGGALALGGWNGVEATASVDRYDVTTQRMTPGRNLLEARDFHAAVTLADGRVLVSGGLHYTATGAMYSDTAEVYDPTADEWRFTFGAPVRRRAGHRLTRLPDGRVLVSGGEAPGTAGGTVEIFDPVTETFRSGKFTSGSSRQNHAITFMNDGAALLFVDGGSPVAEYFDVKTEAFAPAGVGSVPVRIRSTASALPGGRVIIAGGFDVTDPETTLALRTLDLYIPTLGDYGRIVSVDAQLAEPRAGHVAHTLANGDVVFIGGVGIGDGSSFSLNSIEKLEHRDE